jgi:phospholipid/cholesterol/gamma-HCH transport system substrate-binding protein
VRRRLRRARAQVSTLVLMAALAAFGLGVGGYLVVHERIVWPSWLPVLGQHTITLNAEVSAVSGVLPGQGQAVTVSGVTVGQISGLRLRRGLPVVSMEIQPQYANRIYSNATVLLRPKTGLNDMVAELDPGSPRGGHRLASGATLAAASTLPTVNFDEILAQLDADTRGELVQLVDNGGQAVAGQGGKQLGNVLRDFDPLSRDVEQASHLVALRSVELRRLMGNLAQVATELGDNESALTRWVVGNEGVWRSFARQDQNLRGTLALLPPALQSTNSALAKATKLGQAMQSAFGQLDQSARGFGTTAVDLRSFFKGTTPVIRDDLRPFSVKAQPTARLLAPATHRLARATPGLGTLAKELNNIVNELAYKPPHGQSYLFYVPWDNHNSNSVLSSQDGVGPARRSLLYFTCGTLSLLNNFLNNPNQNPTLTTLIELLGTANYQQNCNGSLPK